MAASTQFGLAEQLDRPMLYSTDPDNTQGILMLRYRNGSSSPVNIRHDVSCSGGQILLPDNEDLTAIVKPNTVYMKGIPVTIVGAGKAVVHVQLHDQVQTRTWAFSMHGIPPSNSIHSLPVAEAGRSLPIRYFLAGTKRNIMARIVTLQGIEAARIRLRPEQWLDGFMYIGSIRLPQSLEGRVVLEVIE